MTPNESKPSGLLHSADELRQLIRENPTFRFSSLRVRAQTRVIIRI